MPGGVLAIWSAGRDPAFTRRLEKAGFAVEEVEVRARPNSKGRAEVGMTPASAYNHRKRDREEWARRCEPVRTDGITR